MSDSPLSMLREIAARTPDAPALLSTDGDVLTYARLADQVEATAASLRAAGLHPDDRVAVVLDDGVAAAVLFLAIATVGVCCPLNPAFSAEEFDRSLAALQPALMIVPPGATGAARAAGDRAGVPSGPADGVPAIRATRGRAGGGECLLLQTSGTTGAGKLVPIDWTTALAGARASAHAYGLTPADRRLNVMPFFHVQGLIGSLLASLCCGSSVVCASRPRPDLIPAWLDAVGATWFSASPAMHGRILDASEPGRVPATLRFVRCGSAALPAALRERLEAHYQVPVVESYGMTEAHQIASTPLVAGATEMRPTGSEVAVRAGGVVTATPGVRGEIVVRGGNVIGRYADEAATAESFADGWFRTGDEGELTAAGGLRITGRIKDMIIRGGEKVVPAEVESVLLRHPAIAQVVVVGLPDEALGEQVGALIVTDAGATVSDVELREFARAHLAPFKVPAVVVRRPEIPVTAGGKVSRHALAQEILDNRVVTTPAITGRSHSPVEAALLGIWSHALGTPVTAVDQDFVALGGQSLEGLTLVAMVEDVTGVRMDLLTLFDEANTVARMADVITRAGRER